MEVRETAWDDPVAVVLRAQQRAFIDAAYGGPDSEPGVAPSASDVMVFLVGCADDGTPIACGGLRRIDAATAEIKRMFVATEHRGTGAAAEMLRALEGAARDRGVTRLVLETGDRLVSAIRFYEREGYRRIPQFGGYVGSAISLCFGRDLVERGESDGSVTLESWPDSGDLELLRRLNAPAMMRHLGGPETDEKLLVRDRRYRDFSTRRDAGIFRVLVDGVVAGGVNFWASEHHGEAVYEIGWATLPEFQRRGVAHRAVLLAIDAARAQGAFASVHAFPSVQNAASNALCRSTGFDLVGPMDVEYPPGSPMTVNDWALRLEPASPRASPRLTRAE